MIIRLYKCSKCSFKLANQTIENINSHRKTHDQPELSAQENETIIRKTNRKNNKKKNKQKNKSEYVKKLENKIHKLRVLMSQKQEKKKYNAFYDSREWQEVRYFVLKRDGRVCALCKETKGQIHVDHIIPRATRPDLSLEPDNLQVLCKACNLGKSNKDQTDFRERK